MKRYMFFSLLLNIAHTSFPTVTYDLLQSPRNLSHDQERCALGKGGKRVVDRPEKDSSTGVILSPGKRGLTGHQRWIGRGSDFDRLGSKTAQYRSSTRVTDSKNKDDKQVRDSFDRSAPVAKQLLHSQHRAGVKRAAVMRSYSGGVGQALTWS